MQKGFARPGYFFIDPNGIIREKFFEPKYRERLTGNSLIAKLFPELGQEVTTTSKPHISKWPSNNPIRRRFRHSYHPCCRSAAAPGCACVCARSTGL